ncbi:MAG: alpha/beta hydrolase [Lentisphaeria bacterium]|nr:alpha/beta hydrolase [Lentisphaeria bacterium]NQZ68747.1 alpha/beta hydrolase [Lentisphaeria bacterium]
MKKMIIQSYKDVDNINLNMHMIRPDDCSDEPLPAIVFFFCGAWTGFDASKFYPHSVYLASRGMVCFHAELRVEPIHGTTPMDCVIDGKSAVRWLRSHAKSLGIDPNRLAVGGGSAAGHVSACCGIIDGLDDPQDMNPDISSIPNAMVLYNPVLDLLKHDRWINLFGGLEVARSLSPTQHLKQGVPPALVMHGNADEIVEVEQAIHFNELMSKLGNHCELRLYDKQAHGFFNYFDGENPLFTETLRETDIFLTSLGFLNGPEQIDTFVYDPEDIEKQWLERQQK